MTRASLREYAAVQRERHRQATRAEKRQLLDEVVVVAGIHRKATIRLLRRAPRPRAMPGPGGRPRAYGPEVATAAEVLWQASGRPSGAESNSETRRDYWWEGAAVRRLAEGGAAPERPRREQAQVGEELAHHARVLHRGDEPQAAPEAPAHQDVQVEGPLHYRCPRLVAWLADVTRCCGVDRARADS